MVQRVNAITFETEFDPEILFGGVRHSIFPVDSANHLTSRPTISPMQTAGNCPVGTAFHEKLVSQLQFTCPKDNRRKRCSRRHFP